MSPVIALYKWLSWLRRTSEPCRSIIHPPPMREKCHYVEYLQCLAKPCRHEAPPRLYLIERIGDYTGIEL
jgi:hypothetical protein